MEMADKNIKYGYYENRLYPTSNKNNVCSYVVLLVIILFVIGLTIGSLYLKTIEQKDQIHLMRGRLEEEKTISRSNNIARENMEEEIQRLDAKVRNTSQWFEMKLHLITNMQEDKIQFLEKKLGNISKEVEANSNHININQELQHEAQGQVQLSSEKLENISKIAEINSDLIANVQKAKFGEKIQLLDRKLQYLSEQEERNFHLITVVNQTNIKVRNLAFNEIYCLDKVNENTITVRPCQEKLYTQFWLLTRIGEIRQGNKCLDYDGTNLVPYICHGQQGHQRWLYKLKEKLIQHGHYTQMCLSVSDSKKELTMEACDGRILRQQWKFESPWVVDRAYN